MSYHSNQYGTQQTGAQNVPQQQQRQSSSQPRYQTSTSAQVSSRSEYPEQITVYPSYNNRAPQAQQAYLDPYGAGYGNPAFPLAEPHSSPTSGSHLQRSPSGQSATQYPSASSSVQRSPSGQSGHYSSTSSAVQRNYSGQPTTLYAPSSSSVQHSQPATHYPPASSAVQHNYTGQSTAYYPPTQAFDSTNTSYPGSQPAPTSHYGVPHGHGTNASDGSRSSNHLYQTAAPVTHGTLEPPYRGAQPSQERGVAPSQPYRQDAYEYDNVDEHRPKGPSAPPVQGPHHICRLPECNRPMFFDRRVSDFWEWCSPRHIYAGLERRIEKVCRHCEVWPRKYGHKYCGGPSCNKNGVPIPSN